MHASGLHRVRRICCRCGGPERLVLSLMASSRPTSIESSISLILINLSIALLARLKINTT